MKECASCKADIPESASACELCGQQVIVESVSVSSLAVPSEQPPTPSATSPASKRKLSQRELVAAAGAALAIGVVTLVVLMGRGGTSAHVAAAPAATTSSPASSPRPAAAAPADDTVKWNSDNRVHWTGSKRNSAAFELHAENMVAIWMRHVRPLLVVRCMSNSTDAFVITDSALKIEPQTDDHTVTFSFDNEPETKERWQDAADHNALFAPDSAAFVQRLTQARILRFGYTPHNAEPVTAVFHVNGLGALIEPVAKHCGWTK